MLRTLRQPRYAALSVLMLIIAMVCVAAGTWQIARYEQKKHENDDLRRNDHAPVASVGQLLPLTGSGRPSPSGDAIDFRRVRVTGSYDTAHQSLVRNRTVGDSGTVGYLVLTPLDAGAGTLLVVRGFIADSGRGAPQPPAPPSGTLTVTGRLVTAETRRDAAGSLPSPQVESINPAQQAARLGRPVYVGYAELMEGQPGTQGLTAIPEPDLSNPAGGALEPQHFAYVIQWYLFALLALAAPVAMARSETKQQRGGEIDDEPLPATEDEQRAAKLADRYGRAR